MNKKYRLLPEQVENLKKLYNDSLVNLHSLNIAKSECFSDMKSTEGLEITVGVDASLLGSLTVVTRDYHDAKDKLSCYELIEPNNSDIIGIGSVVEVLMNFDGEEELETLTLVEVRNVCDPGEYISVDSPLGRAVLGKSEEDPISYMVGSRKITGTVHKIIKQKQKTL